MNLDLNAIEAACQGRVRLDFDRHLHHWALQCDYQLMTVERDLPVVKVGIASLTQPYYNDPLMPGQSIGYQERSVVLERLVTRTAVSAAYAKPGYLVDVAEKMASDLFYALCDKAAKSAGDLRYGRHQPVIAYTQPEVNVQLGLGFSDDVYLTASVRVAGPIDVNPIEFKLPRKLKRRGMVRGGRPLLSAHPRRHG